MSTQELHALLESARAAKADSRIPEGLALSRRVWALLGPAERGEGGAPCGALAAEVGSLIVNFSLRCGRHLDVLEFGQAMLQVLTLPSQVRLRIELLRFLTGASLELANFDSALNHATACCALADRLGDVSEQAPAYCALASCYSMLGDHKHAEQVTLEALRLAERGPPGIPQLAPLSNLCAITINAYFQRREVGDQPGSQAALERSFAYSRRFQDRLDQFDNPDTVLSIYAKGNLGETLLHLGEHREAEQRLSEAFSMARSLGLNSIAWRMLYLLAEVKLTDGLPQEAHGMLQQVLHADAKEVGMPTLERTHLALYRCGKELGWLQQALDHLEEGRRIGMQRTQAQLEAQSRLFVTRLEADRSRQLAESAQAEARRQQALVQEHSEAAMTDPLTGLHNRRHLESRVPALLMAARDAGRPLSLAMLDLDHFKSVNDRFGHPVGDQVLIRLAKILRERMRSEDHLVRMGGEEFLLILSGAPASLALEICGRLRQAVAAHAWSDLHADLRVTASIGLASAPDHELQNLIDRADGALYEAKKSGRDRVCVAEQV